MTREEKRKEKLKLKYAASVLDAVSYGMQTSGYSDAGASFKKRSLKGFTAHSSAPAKDIDANNMTMRQRGRMLYMAAPVATGAINTNRTKVVGSGLKMKCAINRDVIGLSEEAAQKWQRDTEAEWRMWCEKKSCDGMELNNFYELQQIAMKSWLMSGDVFALIKRYDTEPNNPYTMRIQLVEADRISTPTSFGRPAIEQYTTGTNPDNGNTVYDGVEVDGNGKVVAYHICDKYPDEVLGTKASWTRVTAKGERTGLPNILHIMDAERPDQYRGVSYLAPVVEILLQLRRYTESELTAAIIQSYFTAWVETEADTTAMPFNEVDEDEISASENEYELGPGTINIMKPGEKVAMGNPNMPTAGFEAFMKSIIKQVGSALELPYDVLIKEFNASYSAAKGALEEAWEAFKMRRNWFVADFCQPIYEAWLAEAVAIGRIKAPGFFTDPRIRAAYCGARWDGPAQTHLDPVKEANAAVIQVSNGWKTNEQVTRELYGENWHDNIVALKEERTVLGDVLPVMEDEE